MKNKNKRFRLLLATARINNYLVVNHKQIRKRALVFLVFLVLSTTFWYYRALDDTYVAEIKYPVRFRNLPQNKILTGNPPEKLILKVRGVGYTILNNKVNPPILNFDVNNFSFYNQTDDSLSVYLVSKLAKETLISELSAENEGLEIISISPDTIFFNFTKTKSKKIPIKAMFADRNNLFAQQHTLNGRIILKPDSVTVVGPLKMIDTLQYVFTKSLTLNNLSDTVSKKTGLESIPGAKLMENKVRVLIPVDRFTETGFQSSILLKNIPDSANLKIFPTEVRISYKVTLSQYNKITKEQFNPYIDYNDIKNTSFGNVTKLKVYINSVPDYVQNITISPSKVEYLIERKNVKNRDNRRDW